MEPRPLTVIQMLPELESGGVERGVLETGAYLHRNGHRSIVISGGGRLVPKLEASGSEHVCWDVGKKSPSALKYVAPLRSMLAKERVDILHLRSRVPAWLGFMAAKSLPQSHRPGIITTFHGFYSVHFGSSIMARGDRVIAISDFIAEHILDNYKVDRDKITVIHRGFDAEHFNPDAVSSERIAKLKKHWGIEDNKSPVIMLPARITGWKGHGLFLEALSQIKDMDFCAICVGDTEDNPAYTETLREEVDRLELAGKVVFAGHCDDMAAALMTADVAASASIEPEAFGRVAVEAQAMGIPVIATSHGGSLETVLDGKTGWLVDHENPAEMAKALSDAILNPDKLKTFGRQAAQWVSENFTTDMMCQKTMAVYREFPGHGGRV